MPRQRPELVHGMDSEDVGVEGEVAEDAGANRCGHQGEGAEREGKRVVEDRPSRDERPGDHRFEKHTQSGQSN